MSLFLSVRLSVAQHISGTVHYVIIIFFLGGGGLNLQPNFQKKGGLTGPQLLEGDGVFERGLRSWCTLCRRYDHAPYDHDFWYTCAKWWYLQGFFSFFQNFAFPSCYGVKGQKMAQNDRNFCPLYSIFQEPYIIWWLFMVHMCEMIISPGVFFMFSKFWYSGLFLGGGRGDSKKCPKMKKNPVGCAPYLRNHTWSSFMLYLCKVTVSLGIFSFFQNFDFPGWKKKSIQCSQYLGNRKSYDHDL